MIYFAPGGIHAKDMAIRKACLIVPNPSRPSTPTPFGGVS